MLIVDAIKILLCLQIYILMILMLGLESVVRYHQAQHYRHPNHERPKDGIVFIDIKRIHADQGLKQCFKFFVNYSFYKFGKEVSMLLFLGGLLMVWILLMNQF